MLHHWKNWSVLRVIFLMAGTFAVAGTLLGYYVHPYFFILPVLVGAMQIIFATTGFCPAHILLRKCGVKCDAEGK